MRSRQDIYAARARSIPQRIVLTIVTAAYVAGAWWLLFGGMASVGTWLGWSLHFGNATRRLCLGIALSIYFVRLVFTQFVFLKRALRWTEAATIGIWLMVIYLVFAVGGGTNRTQGDGQLGVGVFLFVVGSWMNSYAEYQRHRWKQHARNQDRLYTQGLFRYSRHPNYLGDLISFTGICLICGRWLCTAIPGIMLAGFVFVNIPMLDSHLRDHYGEAFDQYAKRTSKLIPFLY
jgi:protein-S-isoprenylcysteine O-methyltransferase Ste14